MLLKKDRVDELLRALCDEAAVYVPKEVSGIGKFAPYPSPDPMKLDMVKTKLPPKDLLFPQSEKMYRYGYKKTGEMYVEPLVEGAPQVLFGVHPCDVRSIECMDDVFLTRGYVDDYYRAKRENLLIVALGCTAPAEACFCDSVGLSPTEAPAADIMLNDVGDAYVVRAQTERGRAALSGTWAPFVEDGEGEAEVGEVHCVISVNTKDLKATFDELYDSAELWDGFSTKCLNCGTCTFICPSCYCFDIDQENRCKEGVRFRCWDSCMFSEYTSMAGGHNPRPAKVDRFRNRYMHKLSYFEDRYGKILCVGCGRCMENCPVGVDITMLIERAQAIKAAAPQTETTEGAANE